VSLNRYTYAAGNPLRYFDPDGHHFTEGTNNDGTYTYSGPGPHTSSSSNSSASFFDRFQAATDKALDQMRAQAEDTNPQPQPTTTDLFMDVYGRCLVFNNCDDTDVAFVEQLLEGTDPQVAATVAMYTHGESPSHPLSCSNISNSVLAFACGAMYNPLAATFSAIILYQETWEGLKTEYHNEGVAGATWNVTGGALVACANDFASPSSTAEERGEATTCLLGAYYGAKAATNAITSVGEATAGRVIAIDADALLKFDQLGLGSALGEGDRLVVTPNVVAELQAAGIKDIDAFLSKYGATAVDSAAVGTAQTSSRLVDSLDGIVPHHGNPGDALNMVEAAYANVDLFITADANTIGRSFGIAGEIAIPGPDNLRLPFVVVGEG
jgi:hypothetical protein